MKTVQVRKIIVGGVVIFGVAATSLVSEIETLTESKSAEIKSETEATINKSAAVIAVSPYEMQLAELLNCPRKLISHPSMESLRQLMTPEAMHIIDVVSGVSKKIKQNCDVFKKKYAELLRTDHARYLAEQEKFLNQATPFLFNHIESFLEIMHSFSTMIRPLVHASLSQHNVDYSVSCMHGFFDSQKSDAKTYFKRIMNSVDAVNKVSVEFIVFSHDLLASFSTKNWQNYNQWKQQQSLKPGQIPVIPEKQLHALPPSETTP